MIGVVVIGRNEGSRLVRCFESVQSLGYPVVYVDSCSTDNSVALAETFGVSVVRLDSRRPLNAARGRKAGFDCVLRDHPGVEQVLFIDGDCELIPGFLSVAQEVLAQRPDVAVVCGRRVELCPQESIYNRLADLEWDAPVGECVSCGGDALMRVHAYVESGGFDDTVLAGEEPELCLRIRRLGYKVVRIDAPMTRHDLNMHGFAQWWRRGVRSGYGALDVRVRRGVREFDRLLLSAWIWAVGVPCLALALACGLFGLFGQIAFVGTVSVVLLLLAFQTMRIAVSGSRRGLSNRDSAIYGILMMVDKASFVWGQIKWLVERKER